MSPLSLDNDVFRAYAMCTAVLSLKMTVIAWHTVVRMLDSGLGNRAPEDVQKGLCNPNPKGKLQLEKYEPVERLRRMMAHDIENNVGFFAVGLLYVICQNGGPMPIWVYTGTKVAHHFVYLSGMPHEVRATFWTATSLASVLMAWRVLEASAF